MRAAIAAFAEANVSKLQGWMDEAAKKDPGRAADLFLRALEYHIPKLARTETTVGGEIALATRLVIKRPAAPPMPDIEYDYTHVPTVLRFSESRKFLRAIMGPFGSGSPPAASWRSGAVGLPPAGAGRHPAVPIRSRAKYIPAAL